MRLMMGWGLSLVLFWVGALFGATSTLTLCEQQSLAVTHQGWQFVPTKLTRYKDSYFFSGETRIEEVVLTLDSHDDLDGISKALAPIGTSPETIKKTIESKIRDNQPILLKDLLPEFPRKKTNEFSTCKGVNCFNAILNWHDPKIGVEVTTEGELATHLAKDYSSLGSGENIQFGDVIAIRLPDGTFVHTAIYLDDNLLWHKASINRSDPWTFESPNQVLQYYQKKYGHIGIHVDFFRYHGSSNIHGF